MFSSIFLPKRLIEFANGYPRVDTFDDLPDVNNEAGKIYIVLNPQGTWLLGTKRRAGLYYADPPNWRKLGVLPIDDSNVSSETLWSSNRTRQEINSYFVAANINTVTIAVPGVQNIPMEVGIAQGGITADHQFTFPGIETLYSGSFQAKFISSVIHGGNNTSRSRVDVRLQQNGVDILGQVGRPAYLRQSPFGTIVYCETLVDQACSPGDIITAAAVLVAGNGSYQFPALGAGETAIKIRRVS